MKINIPLLILIILTLSFSSCSKKEDSTTAATSTDPAAITGETMTIGSIDYTSSLLSSCYDVEITSTAGDSVYGKEQIFLYDNKTTLRILISSVIVRAQPLLVVLFIPVQHIQVH